MTFNTGNAKGSDHCFIGDVGIMPSDTYLTGCIGEIIGFYRSLTDKEISHIHQYLMEKWGIADQIAFQLTHTKILILMLEREIPGINRRGSPTVHAMRPA